MRLHYLSLSTLVSDEANAVHVLRMCAAFARAGHEVTLHALRGAGADHDVLDHYGIDPGRAPDLTVRRWPESGDPRLTRLLARIVSGGAPGPVRGLAKVLLDGRTVRRAVTADQPDLLYARNAVSLLAVPRRLPFVLESHAPPMTRADRLVEGHVLRRRSLRRVVVISAALAAMYRDRYPWVRDRMVVAHDAADDPFDTGADGGPGTDVTTDRGLADGPRVASSHAESGAPDHRLRVGYVGHLYDGRGGPMIARLVERCPHLQFEVVGGTARDVERLRRRLRSDNVVLHGHVPPRDLPDHYRRLDVLIAPYESRVGTSRGNLDIAGYLSPMKLFEYLSWGRAIVCSDLPVLREILTDGSNALLVEPDDLEAWVAALDRLERDPHLVARLGAQARADFLARHTWDARATDVLPTVP